MREVRVVQYSAQLPCQVQSSMLEGLSSGQHFWLQLDNGVAEPLLKLTLPFFESDADRRLVPSLRPVVIAKFTANG